MSLAGFDITATESPGPDLVANEAKLRVDIESHRLKLPVLPNVVMEVLSNTLDDGVDSARLAGLIQKDQSLATHVLRGVNSPAFGQPPKLLPCSRPLPVSVWSVFVKSP